MCAPYRQYYLATFFLLFPFWAFAQFNHCDSVQWNFSVNQFAIDGDNLLADLSDKGWDQQFFQTKEIEVTIYGATDCPGTLAYNTKLAGNRALYLLNYFEVSAFPRLTVAESYAIPERNCTKPGQGYNKEDRVTHLKVCWKDGDQSHAVDLPKEKQPEVDARITEGAIPVDTAATRDSVSQITENVIDFAREKTGIDSANISKTTPDTAGYILPTKPKKIFTLEKTADLNTGDELIVEGLNFYPGSHRTLPEAKPILRKLLETMQSNPTMMIEIQGHVCCASRPNEDGLDDETGDFRLSWNRAQFVRDYLVQNGIAPERITYRGYAMTHPLVYPEVTIQDQIKNRRVEILITAE